VWHTYPALHINRGEVESLSHLISSSLLLSHSPFLFGLTKEQLGKEEGHNHKRRMQQEEDTTKGRDASLFRVQLGQR